MKPTVLAGGILFLTAACSGGDAGAPAVPAATFVVDSARGDAIQPVVSPDSTRLAWAQTVDGASAIFVGNPDGSNAVQLTHGVWDTAPVWSPDSRMIAYLAESPDFDLFVVSIDGSEPRQLTSQPGQEAPRQWLPDGSGVVYAHEGVGPVHTLVAPLDGSSPRPLLPPIEGNQYGTMSPDGSRAAFTLIRGGSSTVWVQDLDGGEARQITDEGLEEGSIQMWSPDGRSVAYTSRRTGTWDIWIFDLSTGERRQLTTDIHNDEAPLWSPDGQWIAFRSDRGGQTDLWIVPAAGGTPSRVTDDLLYEQDFVWAADGRSLYVGRRDLTVGLKVVPIDGSPARDLIDWPGYATEAVDVSPDGTTVLFESNRSGNADIWSVPFAGGEPSLFAASPVFDEAPVYSPDGARVLFHSHRGGTGDLWVMPATGGDAVRLTNGPSDDGNARWSPDGSMIAFASDMATDRRELWVIPSSGGEARRLTTDHGDIADPRWSDDSTIYFIGVEPGGTQDLFRVTLDGGQPEALGASPYIGVGDLSPDGMHYAYASFEGGWAFIDVIPTTGGPPRRLTNRTDRVYQSALHWSRDGASIFVSDLDFADDSDDLQIVSWPAGEWSQLTRTPGVNERPEAIAPNGDVIVLAGRYSGTVVSIDVSGLIAGGGTP